MPKDWTVTTVSEIPPCDLNHDHGPAYADASLPYAGCSWAYVCRNCFIDHNCTLGQGHGQRLIERTSK